MAPLSLKIILEGGSVTRTLKFDSKMFVADALNLVEHKILNGKAGKDYGLFLKSAEDERRGVWLESDRQLDNYMLRDGDSLDYMTRIRNLKLRMLDGHVKTIQVDESLTVEEIMLTICRKIGITNYDEYGLCCESSQEPEDQGSMTLKRKTTTLTQEKDTQLEQLSKKLKTDDNVFWLSPHDTLREQYPSSWEPLLLKRRLFYTDNKVDSRDPVQLSLLYVQVRDAILDGKHPVTLDKAVEFAAIQCQVQFGDFNPEKHKPGFLENLREFLPEQYSGAWGVEKEIFKSYRLHSGHHELEAKVVYIKTARSMPTYGVTFFLVKEQLKDKKKLVPRLLGISAESILRLDQETKAVLQTWPLTQVKSWNARKGTFVLNFGDYSDKEYCVKTNDAFRIRDILQGYIDVMKRSITAPWNPQHLEEGAICEDLVQYSSASVITHVVTAGQQQQVMQQTYTGPNAFISSDSGQQIPEEDIQTVTTHRVIVVDKGTNQTHAILSGSGTQTYALEKKLNGLNAGAVQIIALIKAEPVDCHSAEVKNIVHIMKEELPAISSAVAKISNSEVDSDKQKQLLKGLSQLRDTIEALDKCVGDNTQSAHAIEELCMETADRSAMLYFTLHPKVEKDSDEESESEESVPDPVALGVRIERFNQNAKKLATIQDSSHYNSAELNEVASEMKDDFPYLIATIEKLAAEEKDESNLNELLDQLSKLRSLDELLQRGGRDRCHLIEISERCKDVSEQTEKLLFVLYQKNNQPGNKLVPEEFVLDPETLGVRIERFNQNAKKLATIQDSSHYNGVEINEVASEMKDDFPYLIATIEKLAAEEKDKSNLNELLDQLSKLRSLDELLQRGGRDRCHLLEISKRCKDVSEKTEKLLFILYKKNKQPEYKPCPIAQCYRRLTLEENLDIMNTECGALLSYVENNPSTATGDEMKEKMKKFNEVVSNVVTDFQEIVDKENDIDRRDQLFEKLTELKYLIAKLNNLNDPIEMADICRQINNYLKKNGIMFYTYSKVTKNPTLEPERRDKKPEQSDSIRKLNRLNSNSLNVVSLITQNPKEGNSEEITRIITTMSEEFNEFIYDAEKEANKNRDEAKRKQLLRQLQDLRNAIAALERSCGSNTFNADEIEDQCKKLAHLSTTLSFHLDPACIRRSAILSKSRQSFIEDDKALSTIQHAQLICAVTSTQEVIDETQRMIKQSENIPISLSKKDLYALEMKTADKISDFNSALARFLLAYSDLNNIDYASAKASVNSIKEYSPAVVEYVLTLSKNDSDKYDKLQVDNELDKLCVALKMLCSASKNAEQENLYEAVMKFSNASANLMYAVGRKTNTAKEDEILELAKDVCNKTSVLLGEVRQVSVEQDSEQARWLDAGGVRAAHAARALLACAQLTAPSISSVHCQNSLTLAIESLSSTNKTLAFEWSKVTDDKVTCDGLVTATSDVATALENLKFAYSNIDDTFADVDIHINVEQQSETVNLEDILQESEEKSRLIEKEMLKEAIKNTILNLEKEKESLEKESLQKIERSNIILDAIQTLELESKVEENIAKAAVTVNSILECKHQKAIPDKQSILSIGDLMTDIVNDSLILSCVKSSSKETCENLKTLLEDTKILCAGVDDESADMNTLSVNYSTSAAKILDSVIDETDAACEQKVIRHVRQLGKLTSELVAAVFSQAREKVETAGAGQGVREAGAGSREPMLVACCDAGRDTCERASNMLYTAKLMSHTIRDPMCQKVLKTSFDDLSTSLQCWRSTWQPLYGDPQYFLAAQQFEAKAVVIQELIDSLDLKELVPKRKVAVEEKMPLLQLAIKLRDHAQVSLTSEDLNLDQRQKMTDYVDRLAQAISDLDRANIMCQKYPEDRKKRSQLETAVFNLQQTLLQTRPNVQNTGCIVDLTDYISDVSKQANEINEVLKEIKEISEEKSSLLQIQENIDDLLKNKDDYDMDMQKFMQQERDPESVEISGNGIAIIADYAESNEAQLDRINSEIEKLNDVTSKEKLQNKMAALYESNCLLRFATQSAQATEQGAALDAATQDLDQLKAQLSDYMKPMNSSRRPDTVRALAHPSRVGVARAAAALAGAGGGAAGAGVGGALLAYIAAVRAATDLHDEQLVAKRVEEIQKLICGFKRLSMDISRRLATWRPAIDEANEELLRDFITIASCEDFDVADAVKLKQAKLMSELLMPIKPNESQVYKDERKLHKDLHQTASKLNATAELLRLNVGKQQSLERSSRAIVDVARQLAAISKNLHTKDPHNNSKINTASEELLFVTYNLLKVVNDFGEVSTVTPVEDLELTCGELVRVLQHQQKSTSLGSVPTCHHSYRHCLELLQQRLEEINKIKENSLTWTKLPEHIKSVSLSIRDSVDLATQSAYLLSISKNHQDLALHGLKDITTVKKMLASIKDNCLKLIREDVKQCNERKLIISDEINKLTTFMTSDTQLNHTRIEKDLSSCDIHADDREDTVNLIYKKAVLMTGVLTELMNEKQDKQKINTCSLELVDMMITLEHIFDDILMPKPHNLTTEEMKMTEEIISHSDSLLTSALSWLKEAKSCQRDSLTWVVFGSNWKKLLGGFDSLVRSVRENGKIAGVIKIEEAEISKTEEVDERNGLDIQLDKASKWLKKKKASPETAAEGREAVLNIIQIATTLSEDLPDESCEELRYLISETRQLLSKENIVHTEDNRPLDIVRELKNAVDRGVVVQVLELFLEDEPVHDVQDIIIQEKDERKRKLLLDQKISELLAHLARVTKTARIVGLTRTNESEITRTTHQAELMAPELVKCVQKFASTPHEQVVRDEFEELKKKYALSLEMIQKHCDDSLDPLEFSQTAGDVVENLREHSSTTKRTILPERIAFTVTKLANRVVNVGLKSEVARADPDLLNSLMETKKKLEDQQGTHIDTADHMLRVINEMESVFGGENIFKNQPASDQPIFSAALGLHACVREWSSRHNELVRAASRMAVLLARLQRDMDSCNKTDLLETSKSIVSGSLDVTRLAKILAQECSDLRIRNNLLQVCDRLPTISGQLKMLTTVKGSTFGKHDVKEDQEAMNTLVGNAENLMSSVHCIVKNAMSATVKIQSQGGARIKWVKKQF